MRLIAAALLVAACAPVSANEDQTQRAIQRALIDRDQQSARFAAQMQGAPVRELDALHARQLSEAGRPLHPDPAVARELRGYERERAVSEGRYVLTLPPPPELRDHAAPSRRDAPLPLPGGPRHGVEPVAAPRLAE